MGEFVEEENAARISLAQAEALVNEREKEAALNSMNNLDSSSGLHHGRDSNSTGPAVYSHYQYFVSPKKRGLIRVDKCPQVLSVALLQSFLNEEFEASPESLDYVHGTEVVEEKTREDNSDETFVAFLLPGMQKQELFKAVRENGVLPRKTFSMGHAVD